MKIIFEPEKPFGQKYTFNNVPEKAYRAIIDILSSYSSSDVETDYGKCVHCKWSVVNNKDVNCYPCAMCSTAIEDRPYYAEKDGRDPWCSLCANRDEGEFCNACMKNSTFDNRRPEFTPIFVVKED
ncbi:MAG: hypothetical protein J6Y02_01210 [Pseudobutyrivibrio sp.]|nr:hypothetical protein [Pseudobutyrivibrio sp.]